MGVTRVVVGGALGVELGCPTELLDCPAELLDCAIELLDGVLKRELVRLLVLSEEEPGVIDSKLTGTSLDSEELEDVSVVLKVGRLLGSELRLEENVELRPSDELELDGLVVGKGTSLINDEDSVVVTNVDVVLVVGNGRGVEGMEIKLELELELSGGGGVYTEGVSMIKLELELGGGGGV